MVLHGRVLDESNSHRNKTACGLRLGRVLFTAWATDDSSKVTCGRCLKSTHRMKMVGVVK